MGGGLRRAEWGGDRGQERIDWCVKGVGFVAMVTSYPLPGPNPCGSVPVNLLEQVQVDPFKLGRPTAG